MVVVKRDRKPKSARIPGLDLFRWLFVLLAFGTSSSLLIQSDVDSTARAFLESWGPSIVLWGAGLLITGLVMAYAILWHEYRLHRLLLQVSTVMWGLYSLAFIPPVFTDNAPWTAFVGYMFVAGVHQVGVIAEVVVAHLQEPEYWDTV